MCTDASATSAMDDYNGHHPSSSSGEEYSDSSLQTQSPTPQMPDTSTSSDRQPPRSSDIPPDPAPRSPERWGCRYYTGLSLQRAQEQAIQRWELHWRPEYGMLVKRTRTFYEEAAWLDPKENPTVESIAAAGFYYDGWFTIII